MSTRMPSVDRVIKSQVAPRQIRSHNRGPRRPRAVLPAMHHVQLHRRLMCGWCRSTTRKWPATDGRSHRQR